VVVTIKHVSKLIKNNSNLHTLQFCHLLINCFSVIVLSTLLAPRTRELRDLYGIALAVCTVEAAVCRG